ncbi:MAG: site-specific DNA-methyltransferase [Synergistaceae bacterium]|nr:site-specific DNA-methyltransferase [Synergistaceae bacterium]
MSTKLELTWPGKEEIFRLEPRILIEKPELSNTTRDPETQNILIHGDNLLALKSLEKKFAGKIKCVYIDPPYNTGAAFEHYDDNFEHSTWLNLMRPRLELLRTLLSNDGSIWISIDDDERDYLKILCDEIFGRNNFVNTVIWEKKYAPQNDAKWLSDNHDFILVYAKNKEIWRPNLLPRTDEMNSRYKNPDNDPRGLWKAGDCSAKRLTPSDCYPITTPSGRVVNPPAGYSWRFSKEKFEELIKDNRIYFGENGDNVPAVKRFLSEVKQGATSLTIWKYTEVGHNQDAKKEVKAINSESVFATPKPEKLIERILTLATNPGDFVLDSFLGSGTTAAVALKMNRKFIGIEIGEHAYTHCKVRLDKVIRGEDSGGVTKSTGWTGGGGYKFFELAPSLMQLDEFGEYVTNKQYDEEMLARAIALHKGYDYNPDEKIFWKQSRGTERSWLYVTTAHVSGNFAASIHGTMSDNEFLTIACKTYDSGVQRLYKNIRIEKIPQIIFDKCEYGREDYNLNVIETPEYEDEDV